MTDNLAIWNTLGKSDPAHTKGFNRAGGFKGTSLKPIWTIMRLTAHFGPAGVGWGVNEPKFELVHSQEGEVLVYCTVSAWHGDKANVLWGVGGDKAVTKRNDGKFFHDDEAFKKAFTDAVGNAFKTIGVAADIHMGLHDDDKYVARMEREFADAGKKDLPTGPINDETRDWIASKIDSTAKPVGEFLTAFSITSLKALTYEQMDAAKQWVRDNRKVA